MTIAVVSCVWQRPERLPRLMEQLAAQSHTDFDLLLICNNDALFSYVEETVSNGALPVALYRNLENRGPFVRLEVMHALSRRYDYFMTIDDDAEFGPHLLMQWWALRDPEAVQGWSGFRFTGNYWKRQKVKPGEECSYLWGSNLFVPVAAVQDKRILEMPEQFRLMADDLWLCYHANHVVGLTLRAQQVDMRIHIDGKDSYTDYIADKREFLEDLRARGWAV